MKIAISADNSTIESKIDQRFGRCKYFIIAETDNQDEILVVENEGVVQGHGAGIKAAEQIGKLGVKAIITGSIGPNAIAVLEKLEIIPYRASGVIKNAIDNFNENRLEEIKEVSEPHSEITKEHKTNEERIFFPLLKDNGMDSEISGHFGHAPFFGIYNINKKELKIIINNLNHTDPNKSPIDQIVEAVNPTTIFAKGIGGRAIELIKESGLQLKTGDYRTIKDVINNLNKLKEQIEGCGHEHY